MWDRIMHKWLKIPYRLHVHTFQSPKRSRATVLLLHGIGNSWKTWQKTAQKMPADVKVIAVDLLGFGASPKPSWKAYKTNDQVNSLAMTLLKRKFLNKKPMIIVGHSLGSLVAIEMARRYPKTVKSLILCSPPLYRPAAETKRIHPERILRQAYRLILRNPNGSSKVLRLIKKYRLWTDPGFAIDEEGILTFLATLDAAIVNQKSIPDVINLAQPTAIVYGKLDPLIVKKNIRYVATQNSHIKLLPIAHARHDITAAYRARIISLIASSRPVSRSDPEQMK